MSGPTGRTRERGSVLMLVPAGFLVVLVLASIAVDLSVVHLRQRQAFDLAAAAANDGVTAGADPRSLRRGAYLLDPGRTADAVRATIEASELGPDAAWSYRATPAGLEVTVTVRASYIFAGVVPGAPDGTEVTATASATPLAG
ncbi:MAG TPA: hypothetical protein VFZ68_01520 [Acidimicrobiales bacterium]